jgi:hypothetical protein
MAKRKTRHTSCTQMRRFVRTHGTLNIATGEVKMDRRVWVTEPCEVPLFGDDEQKRGTCKACHTGWETDENYAVSNELVALQASLPQVCVDLDRANSWEQVFGPPPSFIRNGRLYISGEDEGSTYGSCDYYGEFRGGDPWISPELLQWAKDRGGYWLWENPGCISFEKG